MTTENGNLILLYSTLPVRIHLPGQHVYPILEGLVLRGQLPYQVGHGHPLLGGQVIPANQPVHRGFDFAIHYGLHTSKSMANTTKATTPRMAMNSASYFSHIAVPFNMEWIMTQPDGMATIHGITHRCGGYWIRRLPF